MLKELWNDSVISQIIAAGIISLISIIFLWMRKVSLRRGKRKGERLLVFVSAGGTCRDPMAKAITLKLLENAKLDFELKIKSVGLRQSTSPNVSFAARHAIKELFGEDILAHHKTETMTNSLAENADLILLMSRELLNQFLKSYPIKTGQAYVFKEFFGLNGDIQDPYPDGKDANTFERYKLCAIEMKTIIEKNIDRLINALNT